MGLLLPQDRLLANRATKPPGPRGRSAPPVVCRAVPAPARPWVSSMLGFSPQSKPHRGAGIQPAARNEAAQEPHLSPTPGSLPPTSPPFPPRPYTQSCQFGQIFRNLSSDTLCTFWQNQVFGASAVKRPG